MSAQLTTPFCFRCQHYPSPDDARLKRCGRCRSRHYCSTECQRNDWPRHKEECPTLAAGEEAPIRTRTTMRINLAGMLGGRDQEPEIDPETIYFLKTTKPHLQDISISGPFYPLDKVYPQMLMRLRKEGSSAGEATLNEMVHDDRFFGLEHLNAPLPDGNIMKMQLLRQKNAEVARSLPGDVWKVMVATPVRNQDRSGEYAKVKDMEILSAFTTKEEANRAAEQVLEELKAKAGRGARSHKASNNGLVGGMILTPGTGDVKVVEVQYDDCSLRDLGSPSSPQPL